MVNKTKVHEHIVRLVQEKRIEGITAVRDESNREGVRFVIEVRRDASANVILNNLFKMTQMQTSFGFNMLAIQNGVPKILSLRQILDAYIEHQKEVVTRRTPVSYTHLLPVLSLFYEDTQISLRNYVSLEQILS